MKALSIVVLLALVLTFVILCPIILCLVLIPILKSRKKATEGYVFKLTCSKETCLQQLGTSDSYDPSEPFFDSAAMTLTFIIDGSYTPYAVSVTEQGEGCYIKLSRTDSATNATAIPPQINEFMIHKFNAELLPYEK